MDQQALCEKEQEIGQVPLLKFGERLRVLSSAIHKLIFIKIFLIYN